MNKTPTEAAKTHARHRRYGIAAGVGICALVVVGFLGFERYERVSYARTNAALADVKSATSTAPAVAPLPAIPALPPLDTVLYDKLILQVANLPVPKVVKTATTATSTPTSTPVTAPAVKPSKWPVKAAYPLPGAVLPFHRIVAYYGNFYSTKMGVLGEYPTAQMLSMLQAEVVKWQAADPTIPVIPAIHYIAVTAQGSAGADGKYRARMPDSEIMKAITLGRSINGLTFLDIQPGLSTPELETPYFDKYMAMPDVHLGIDPEFSMTGKGSKKPGTVIGTMDASDINWVTAHLAAIVDADHIPPKILVIHRFTQGMVTNYQNIILRPEVQIVMDMDGWGHQSNKLNAYHDYIQQEPVQFTGFKLFYKNDVKSGSTMLTPAQLLALSPQPLYIQFQ